MVYLVFLNQDSKEQVGKDIQPLFGISFSLSSPSTEVTQTIISSIDIIVEYNHDLKEETHNSEETIDAQTPTIRENTTSPINYQLPPRSTRGISLKHYGTQ